MGACDAWLVVLKSGVRVFFLEQTCTGEWSMVGTGWYCPPRTLTSWQGEGAGDAKGWGHHWDTQPEDTKARQAAGADSHPQHSRAGTHRISS